MTTAINLRLGDELAAWATEFAESSGVSRNDLLETAVATFRVQVESGVVGLRERVAGRAAPGVDVCPRNPGGHVWAAASVSGSRPCVHCGLPGRGPGGFFEFAASERAVLFGGLAAPASVFPAKGQR